MPGNFKNVARRLFYKWFIRKMRSMRKLLPVAMIATFMIACKKEENPNEVNPTDKNFIIQTYLASKAEIETGKLALGKSDNPVILDIAQKMIADYQSAQLDLIAVSNKLNFSMTDTASVKGPGNSGLGELSGYSFDTAYMSSRAKSQMDMLHLFQNELNDGNNTYVRHYFFNKYIDKVRYYYYQADSLSRAF